VADHKKDRECDDEEKGKAEEMSSILREAHRVILVPFKFGSAGAGDAGRDGGTTIRIGTQSPDRSLIGTGWAGRLYVSYVTICRNGMERNMNKIKFAGGIKG
jgi:hypothetical protein